MDLRIGSSISWSSDFASRLPRLRKFYLLDEWVCPDRRKLPTFSCADFTLCLHVWLDVQHFLCYNQRQTFGASSDVHRYCDHGTI